MIGVNHVLLEAVDEGSVAMQRLYPRQGGGGYISAAAEENVLEHSNAAMCLSAVLRMVAA
jgi:hypothetical protein